MGIFKITLQLMRFHSQNISQVQSLLSNVRKIEKGSWTSCFFCAAVSAQFGKTMQCFYLQLLIENYQLTKLKGKDPPL